MHYHMKTHEGRLPFECTFCSKQFLQAYTLDIHIKTQHERENDSIHKCPVENCCYKGSAVKSNLLIHFIRKHCSKESNEILEAKNDLYKCKACDKEMKSSTAFYYHAVSCMTVSDTVLKGHLKGIQDI